MNRILVTGASGLIGTRVCETLRANGMVVSALVVDRIDAAAEAGADRTFVGDAGDVDLVREALADVDAVIHLAALASPEHGSAVDVFAGNTRATFVVLNEAAGAGITKAVIASSYSILGLTFAPHVLHAPYYPIDLGTPLQIEDPYGLSKQVDEATAQMVARRYGMDVVALRFPYVATDERLATRLADTVADPGIAATEAWSYLNVRDAAEAAWLALRAPVSGAHRVFVAAPEILAPFRTEDLIRRYHPDSEIRGPLPGRTTPIDLEPATRLLGFAAQHTIELDPLPLPETG